MIPADDLLRLDRALVDRGLVPTRTKAKGLIRSGQVSVAGVPATRASQLVTPTDPIELSAADTWVGRGALKLDGALSRWSPDGLSVDGRRCVDVGASTGGFTQVLLARGAAHVVALDVGHDQLDASLRTDPRVREESGRTVRGLQPADIGGPFDLLVADLSFISLRTVMPDLARLITGDGSDAVLLVKPQFEVGRGRVGRSGVVRSQEAIATALREVAEAAVRCGLAVRDLRRSDIVGREGNQEYLLWATAVPAPGPPAASLDEVAPEPIGFDRLVAAATAPDQSENE